MPQATFDEKYLTEYRRKHVPLYNSNKLKLGVFSMNCSGGMAITKAPMSLRIEWDYQLALAQLADSLGLEAIVPVARWRGVGGEIDFLGQSFETNTFAAALAASTQQIMTFATVHAPIIHPIVAAKMATTIDHVSNGRFGLNVVMGWLEPEFLMFGMKLRDHDTRYLYGSEWMTIVDRLWGDREPFEYSGQFFDLHAAQAKPKPIQPRPVVINAGSSKTGAAWAARHADFNFGSFSTIEAAREYVSSVKSTARNQFNRDIGLLTYGFVVCRDTEKEAQDALNRIVKMGDLEASHNWLSVLGVQSGSFDAHFHGELAEKFVAGAGAARIVGTPEQVAQQLIDINTAGMDGVFLGFMDWVEEVDYFGKRVLPLLKQAGVRQ